MEKTFHINGTQQENLYDAIVVGSGISGGWAAKELCENGLKTLVLERGRNVEHGKDYPTATMDPWEFRHRLRMPDEIREKNPIVSQCYAFDESTQHFFVKDHEHPYIQKKPYGWIRGYQVGGKSLLWARWTQRWSDLDFEANAREGIGVDWPIRYKDIAPWYSHVEKFAGISGNRDGLPQIPDGEFLPPMEMNCLEKHFKKNIESQFPGRNLVMARTANLTQTHMGRGPCQYRDLCARGCPYAGYFSSVSATIPAARNTGNLTIRPDSVVQSIIYDKSKGRAKGVRVIDRLTKETKEYFAHVIFLNAGTLNSTLILLNSTSSRFPDGFGNDGGVLGHYLMDHNYRGTLQAEFEGLKDRYHFGRRPTGTYIPRYRNLGSDRQKNFLRGYAFSCFGSRGIGNVSGIDKPFGPEFKEKLTEPGPWQMSMTGMGECLPYYENQVTLSMDKKDEWDMPLLEIACEFRENELNMLQDLLDSAAGMLDAAGFINIVKNDSREIPGMDIHEMGTARMGRDLKTSVLNGFNQVHAAKNVFVSYGACMTSSACQNPSITYMALTARAANHAVSELKKRNL